jgi:hypothetical protein
MATAKAITPITIASTAIRKDAHGRYNLNDLHKAAQYRHTGHIIAPVRVFSRIYDIISIPG